MPSYLTSIVLEWSADPLSDTTPTYTTIPTSDIRSIEWWAGVDREDSEPEPGGMVVTLRNRDRRYEPLFAANLIDTQQRFRLTLNGVQEGVWYTESFALDYPSGQEFSWVSISCGDGISVLALDDLPLLDPPEADTYADVVGFDEPFAHYPLDDPVGIQARAAFKTVRTSKGGKGKKRRRRVPRGTSYSVSSEAGATAGPAGVYKTIPSLGQPGLIVGERGTCVLFSNVVEQSMRAAVDERLFVDPDAFTLECWFSPTSVAGSPTFMASPFRTAISSSVVLLIQNGSTSYRLATAGTVGITLDSITAPAAGTLAHVVATYGNGAARIYIDGSEEASGSVPHADLFTPDANDFLYVGGRQHGTSGCRGYIAHAAFYEYALPPDRVLAHFQAGAERGFPQQTAGERIASIATSDLWAETEIQTTGRDVLPVMMHGQPRLEEIAEAMHAEGPRTLFFFNGDGDPVYLGHEWQATDANYNIVQATFTDDGTGLYYNHVQLEYDFETFNEVQASREGGPLITVENTTESGKRGRRVRTEETDVLLTEDIYAESLAGHVLGLYEVPAKRPVSLTIDGHHCLAQILDLDIGHLIRIKKAGETGDPTERVVNIIGKKKGIDTSRHLTCTYNLSRGFDPEDGFWKAGVVGYSEAGSTTVAA